MIEAGVVALRAGAYDCLIGFGGGSSSVSRHGQTTSVRPLARIGVFGQAGERGSLKFLLDGGRGGKFFCPLVDFALEHIVAGAASSSSLLSWGFAAAASSAVAFHHRSPSFI